jgi:hypothetical protein
LLDDVSSSDVCLCRYLLDSASAEASPTDVSVLLNVFLASREVDAISFVGKVATIMKPVDEYFDRSPMNVVVYHCHVMIDGVSRHDYW